MLSAMTFLARAGLPAAVVALILAAPTSASAAPASASAAPTSASAAPAFASAAALAAAGRGTVTAQALPPYETWIGDVTAVAAQASAYLDDRLPDASIKPAVVLDIDNTALQTTYRPGLTAPATGPILDLARQAGRDGAEVFFVTARPEILGWQTEINLEAAGYDVERIFMRPWFNTQPDAELKTDARKAIEAQGFRIVANIGNSASDLSGGHADRTFKLPDYDGQLI